jgi:hypothetical protein
LNNSSTNNRNAMSRPLPRIDIRLILASLFVLLNPLTASAQPAPVSSRLVGPGVTHTKYLLPGPLAVDVMSVSLKEPSVHIETFRAPGLTETSRQAEANDREGHRVLGAVNADFFTKAGLPVGNQVQNGEWVHGTRAVRSHMAIDAHGHPFIERLSFAGIVTACTGSTFSIAGVNVSPRTDQILVFTDYYGAFADTDSISARWMLRLIDTAFAAGNTLTAIAIRPDTGGMPIEQGTLVLGARSVASREFLTSTIHESDTVKLLLGTDPALHGITQIIGGCGRFLAGGRDVTDSISSLEGITTKFTGARHPRTFVGFDRDTTTLYICTVDGRQTSSIGMTFADMFAFLRSLGATEGFNLDGGGSTTMVVRGKIVNSPSDATGERPVANSLQVICTAPDDELPPMPEQ